FIVIVSSTSFFHQLGVGGFFAVRCAGSGSGFFGGSGSGSFFGSFLLGSNGSLAFINGFLLPFFLGLSCTGSGLAFDFHIYFHFAIASNSGDSGFFSGSNLCGVLGCFRSFFFLALLFLQFLLRLEIRFVFFDVGPFLAHFDIDGFFASSRGCLEGAESFAFQGDFTGFAAVAAVTAFQVGEQSLFLCVRNRIREFFL